jgi:hypothetical protein
VAGIIDQFLLDTLACLAMVVHDQPRREGEDGQQSAGHEPPQVKTEPHARHAQLRLHL